MNADRIAEIRERLNKATPGPWAYNEGYFGINANGKRYVDRVANANGMADTRLIAHAPDDLAFLLDLVREVVEIPLNGVQLEHRVDDDTTVIVGDDGMLYSQGETGPLKPLYTIVAGQVETPPTYMGVPLRLAGEVETPCATCGGTGKVLALAGVDTTAYYEKAGPCPDCGVETPEAAGPELCGTTWTDMNGRVERGCMLAQGHDGAHQTIIDGEFVPFPSGLWLGTRSTPCATCNGTGRIPDLFGPDHPEFPSETEPCPQCAGTGTDAAGISDAPCDICGGSGIAPDCGVETPEAAVEAMREAAALHGARFDGPHWACDCGGASGHDHDSYRRHVERARLAALIAQGWTPPGGTE